MLEEVSPAYLCRSVYWRPGLFRVGYQSYHNSVRSFLGNINCAIRSQHAWPALLEEELIPAQLLCEEEIDTLVEQAVLNQEDKWDLKLRGGSTFAHPEMRLLMKTGESYPAEPLQY